MEDGTGTTTLRIRPARPADRHQRRPREHRRLRIRPRQRADQDHLPQRQSRHPRIRQRRPAQERQGLARNTPPNSPTTPTAISKRPRSRGTSNEDTYAYDETDAMNEVKMPKARNARVARLHPQQRRARHEIHQHRAAGRSQTYIHLRRQQSADERRHRPPTNTTKETTRQRSAEHIYKYDAADELEKRETAKITNATYSYDELGERTKNKTHHRPGHHLRIRPSRTTTSVKRQKKAKSPPSKTPTAITGQPPTGQTISGTTTYLAWDVAEKLPVILNDGEQLHLRHRRSPGRADHNQRAHQHTSTTTSRAAHESSPVPPGRSKAPRPTTRTATRPEAPEPPRRS